jgi:hypothetical protein
MNRNFAGSSYGKVCIKFPQNRMKGERIQITLALSMAISHSRLGPDGRTYLSFYIKLSY